MHTKKTETQKFKKKKSHRDKINFFFPPTCSMNLSLKTVVIIQKCTKPTKAGVQNNRRQLLNTEHHGRANATTKCSKSGFSPKKINMLVYTHEVNCR